MKKLILSLSLYTSTYYVLHIFSRGGLNLVICQMHFKKAHLIHNLFVPIIKREDQVQFLIIREILDDNLFSIENKLP